MPTLVLFLVLLMCPEVFAHHSTLKHTLLGLDTFVHVLLTKIRAVVFGSATSPLLPPVLLLYIVPFLLEEILVTLPHT